MRYSADITAGSLKVPESRIVARLLLDGADRQAWKDAIVGENLLQARNPVTAIRLARLIRLRLETMDADLWRLVRDGTAPVDMGDRFTWKGHTLIADGHAEPNGIGLDVAWITQCTETR